MDEVKIDLFVACKMMYRRMEQTSDKEDELSQEAMKRGLEAITSYMKEVIYLTSN